MSNPNAEEYIIMRIREILYHVQSGIAGVPSMQALNMCGQLHAILEDSVSFMQQSSE
jgi:hypothetical protein